MTQIVLTAEQTRNVLASCQPAQVFDAEGNLLGTFQPLWTQEDIREAEASLASNEPRYTTEEVLEYLHSLEQRQP